MSQEKRREKLSKRQIMKEVLVKVDQDLDDEEVLHALLDQSVSANTDEGATKSYTRGQRAADNIARFAGSWTFVSIFIAVLVAWMVLNAVLAAGAFDPYPFILLNLVLSCVAAIQAPLIMMSQNRQEEKDRLRSENDYEVNLKSEFVLRDLHVKMDEILKGQKKIVARLDALEGGEQVGAASAGCKETE